MKNSTTLRDKVIARLIKWGNNKENAVKLVDEHFEFTSKHYDGVSGIATAIIYQ